jgi:hypothetical protein
MNDIAASHERVACARLHLADIDHCPDLPLGETRPRLAGAQGTRAAGTALRARRLFRPLADLQRSKSRAHIRDGMNARGIPIKRELANHGIHEASLFPDGVGIAGYLAGSSTGIACCRRGSYQCRGEGPALTGAGLSLARMTPAGVIASVPARYACEAKNAISPPIAARRVFSSGCFAR